MRTIVHAGFLALAAIGCSVAAHSQRPPQESPDWLSQARIYAEEQGISLGEAVRRSRLQQLAGEQARRFADDPDFAGSWIIQDRNNFQVTFAFKGARTRSVGEPDLAAASNFAATRYSLREIHDERQRLTQALSSRGIDVSFDVDVRESRLVLYPSDAGRVRALVSDGTLSIGEFVVIMDQPLVRRYEAAVSGGGQTAGNYVNPSTGLAYNQFCTAAFNATNETIRGITTAGHCAEFDGQTSYHRGIAIGTRRATWRRS